ncbi:MAG: cytochrome c [Bryobacteraceae bacterium]|nr:cytochrome c [Bryobacteraceae bacterium]
MVKQRRSIVVPASLCVALLAACRQDMHDQPKYKPLTASDFFTDGMASRGAVDGTIARGQLADDSRMFEGRAGNDPIAAFPFKVTKADAERGRQRYDIYCAPCHGALGDGRGMVVERGFRQPPSYHIDRLREAPVGHYFDVITNGFGAMPSYASRVPVRDRWAIVAYVRALQLSQNARVQDLTPEDRQKLGVVE